MTSFGELPPHVSTMTSDMVYSAWKIEKQKLVEFLLGPGHYAIEIGSFCGSTSRVLALTCKILRKQLICIDPWQTKEDQSRYLRYLENIKNLADTVITLRASSCAALELLPSDVRGNVCLLFVDGDHAYPQPLHDMIHYWPLIAEGGVMAVHDVFDVWWHGGIFRALTEFFEDKHGYCLEAINYIPTPDEARDAKHSSSGLIWAFKGKKPIRSSRFRQTVLLHLLSTLVKFKTHDHSFRADS